MKSKVRLLGNPVLVLLLYAAVVMPQVVSEGSAAAQTILVGSKSLPAQGIREEVVRSKASAAAIWATMIGVGALAVLAGSWLWNLGKNSGGKMHHA